MNFFAFFAPQAQHSTAQHSAAQSTRTSSKASTRRSERDNAASRQSRLEPARHRAFIQLAVFSKRTSKKSKSPRPTNIYTSMQNHSQSTSLCWCDVACTLLFLSVLSIRPCMRRPRCFRGPWSSWHLQVASLHLKRWTSPSASSFAFYSILPCERA